MSRLFIRARAPKSKEKPRSTSRLITRAVPAVSIAVTLYLWVRTFSPAPVGLLHWNGGEPYICPRVTVCAEDWVALGLLGATRTLAYLCYPLLMLLFLGKANNLVCALSRSVVGVYVPFHRLHELHASAGVVAGAAFVAHGAGHAARWARQGNARLLWASQTGRTGAVAALLTPLIVVPMRSAACRAALRWELRKALHYLAVLWGLLAALHAPRSVSLPCVGIPLAVYAGDWLYGLLFRTYLVRTSRFTRLARAVQLDFENPPGFYAGGWKSGYVLVCVPWLAKAEWHAFSVFQHPTLPDHSSVCMAVGGDWTRALHDAVSLRPTTRPVWVAGPRHSPYASSFKADNIITVASGIGITPALSVLASQDESRRVNLVWICRDPSLVEFHLEATRFPANGWTLVYYTGRERKLALRGALPRTVLVFCGRPRLAEAIGEVVGGIELGLGLARVVVAAEDADAAGRAARREAVLQGHDAADRGQVHALEALRLLVLLDDGDVAPRRARDEHLRLEPEVDRVLGLAAAAGRQVARGGPRLELGAEQAPELDVLRARRRQLQRVPRVAADVRAGGLEGAAEREALLRRPGLGRKRVRNSQLWRLLSRSFSTRFGSFLDERSSLGANQSVPCFPHGNRFENTHVEATLHHPFPALRRTRLPSRPGRAPASAAGAPAGPVPNSPRGPARRSAAAGRRRCPSSSRRRPARL